MRKTLWFSTIVLLSRMAISQPILTAQYCNPSLSDGNGFYGSLFTYLPPGSGGTNQTWDFSAAVWQNNTPPVSVINPNAAPSHTLYPLSNFATNTAFGTLYDYYETSASYLRYYGELGNGSPYYFSDPQDLLRYPFTYGDSYTDSFVARSLNSTNDTVMQTGSITLTADGYGTVIIPKPNGTTDTFYNVLRISLHMPYKDSILAPPYTVTTTTFSSVGWYLVCNHWPLVNIVTSSPSYVEVLGFPVTNCANGIEELNNDIQFTVFPIPVRNELSYRIELTNEATAEVTLKDILGQLVFHESIKGIVGENQIKHSVQGLNPGVYCTTLRVGARTVMRKVIIE